MSKIDAVNIEKGSSDARWVFSWVSSVLVICWVFSRERTRLRLMSFISFTDSITYFLDAFRFFFYFVMKGICANSCAFGYLI